MDPEDYFDYTESDYDYGYDEYGDWDAMQCATGDYNTHEENCCFMDEQYDNDDYGDY